MRLPVPAGEEPSFLLVDGLIRNLKGYCFVGIASEQQVLVAFIRCLHFLFVRRHESMSRLNRLLGFGVVYFKRERSLFGMQIARFCYLRVETEDVIRYVSATITK